MNFNTLLKSIFDYDPEGPAIAKNLMEPLGLPVEDVERICFIIGHHHTYKAIDGIDFQLLSPLNLQWQ